VRVFQAKSSYVFVELTCSGCSRRWYQRFASDACPESEEVATSAEVEPSLEKCGGRVSARYLSLLTEALDQRARRLEAGSRRFDDYCLDEGGSISVLAGLLDVPVDKAAAIAWAERELEAERERRDAPSEVVLGLGNILVQGCSAANINVQPQVIFRPDHLEVPDETARHFFVTDIKIDKNSQFISAGAVPASVFSDRRYRYLKMQMDVAQVSMFCTVSVLNATAEARNFCGALVGYSEVRGHDLY